MLSPTVSDVVLELLYKIFIALIKSDWTPKSCNFSNNRSQLTLSNADLKSKKITDGFPRILFFSLTTSFMSSYIFNKLGSVPNPLIKPCWLEFKFFKILDSSILLYMIFSVILKRIEEILIGRKSLMRLPFSLSICFLYIKNSLFVEWISGKTYLLMKLLIRLVNPMAIF